MEKSGEKKDKENKIPRRRLLSARLRQEKLGRTRALWLKTNAPPPIPHTKEARGEKAIGEYKRTFTGLLKRQYQIRKPMTLQILVSSFNKEELKTLCFELNIDFEDLPGEGREAKARELVEYMERNGRLDDLVAAVWIRRPNIPLRLIFEDPNTHRTQKLHMQRKPRKKRNRDQ